MMKLRVENKVINSACCEAREADFERIYNTKAFQKMFHAKSYYELMRRLERYVGEEEMEYSEIESITDEQLGNFDANNYEFYLIHSALRKFFLERYRYEDESAQDTFYFHLQYEGKWELT